MIVPETAGFMAAAVPGARLARLAPAGHMAVFERQEELVSDLAKLADEVLPKAGRPLVASSSRK
jgi:pimeloyl-ACP methyl ester carboxylesterase